MRHGMAGRRSRNRGGKGNRRGGPNRAHVYDSNGPDVRIRGTAHQVYDKYETLAKDAASLGDHVLAQSYLQHGEHYQRIINNWEAILRNGGREPEPVFEEYNRHESADDDDADLGLPESLVGASNSTAESQELENA